MDAEELKALSLLLDTVLELEQPERERWLVECGDERRAGLIRDLLARDARREDRDLLERGPSVTASARAQAALFVNDQVVGPYRLLRLLGEGGMGSVWLARKEGDAAAPEVALKLPSRTGVGARHAERLQRECELLAALSHPHIARLLDAGVSAEAQPYLVLEFVHGQPIDAYCHTHALSLEERLALFVQVAGAVAYAHRRQVLHRDLKPANVLVDSYGEVRLLDFGIAKLMQDDQAAESTLTRNVGRALTPEYASPEQLRGEPMGRASDVYSLGVLLYELLSGRRPHTREGRSRADFEREVLYDEPAPPSHVAIDAAARQWLVGDVDAIVCKALQKSVVDRYRHVEALLADVERHRDGRPVVALAEAATQRSTSSRRRTLLGRESELAQLADLMRSRQRWVTVVGPGGVGKTALAAAAAARASDDKDGLRTAWVELEGFLDSANLPQIVAAKAQIQLPAAATVVQLAAALADAAWLLVLDNCEHLTAGLAPGIAQLLVAAPRVRVLATSRVPLGGVDEQVLRLQPLSVPALGAALTEARAHAAFQLLEQRVAAADPLFEFESPAAGAVGPELAVTLCRALDGLPLAIELAAARLPTLGLEGAEALLELHAGSAPHTTRPARQRTLHATLAWSFGLLGEEEQATLRRLSVFTGAFGIDSAQQVVADAQIEAWHALELVLGLVDKSLVELQRGRWPRLRLLETTRRFAAEQLAASPDAPAASSRFLQAMVERARALHTALQGSISDADVGERFGLHYADFDACLMRAVEAGDASAAGELLRALRSQDALGGVVYRMQARLESAARLLPAADASSRALILQAVASCNWVHLPGLSALDAARQATAGLREMCAAPEHLMQALALLATNAAVQGLVDEARAAIVEAEVLALRVSASRPLLMLAVHTAHVCYFSGRPTEALERLQESLPLARALGAAGVASYIALHLVCAAQVVGEHALALQSGYEALPSMRALGHREFLYFTLNVMLGSAMAQGDGVAARELAREALVSDPVFGPSPTLYEQTASWAAQHGDKDAAMQLLGFAQALRKRVQVGDADDPVNQMARSVVLRLTEVEGSSFRLGALLGNDAARQLARSIVGTSVP